MMMTMIMMIIMGHGVLPGECDAQCALNVSKTIHTSQLKHHNILIYQYYYE